MSSNYFCGLAWVGSKIFGWALMDPCPTLVSDCGNGSGRWLIFFGIDE